MTYENKAEVFTRVLAATGSVVEALRAADRAAFVARRGSLTSPQVDELQRERAAGASLAELGERYGFTEGYMSMLCKGIKPGPRRRKPSPLGAPLVAEVARQLGLHVGWERYQPRGKRPASITLGHRALILAMAAGRATNRQIGDVIGQEQWRVARKIAEAKDDPRARDLAQAVLAAVQAAGVTEAVTPLAPPLGVAA